MIVHAKKHAALVRFQLQDRLPNGGSDLRRNAGLQIVQLERTERREKRYAFGLKLSVELRGAKLRCGPEEQAEER
jgi:hypothetical protein